MGLGYLALVEVVMCGSKTLDIQAKLLVAASELDKIVSQACTNPSTGRNGVLFHQVSFQAQRVRELVGELVDLQVEGSGD